MFSAKKIGGKKLYELARKGKTVERQANDIEIHKIKLLKYKWPRAIIKVKVSSGTYIRTLAYDIGKSLRAGAYLEELERTMIGKFKLKKAKTLEKITGNNWQKQLF